MDAKPSTTTGPPATIVAGHLSYRVTQDVRELPEPGEQDPYAGRTYHEHGLIYVRANMNAASQRETFLHELGHVAVWSAGSRDLAKTAALAYAADQDRDSPEEVYLQALSGPLLDLLTRNPEVRAYLWPTK